MADPLSLLRQYNLNKKEIVEKEGNAIFGEFSWPKTVKTNYIIWGSGKDGATKEYYTLECLLFLLKNVHLSHPVYVRKATAENVPVVHLPDRKDLLSYLSQEGATSNSIDRSAPLEMPTQVKRATEESQETQVAKKPRIDGTDVEKAKAQLARRLEQPKETSLTLGSFKSISMTISAEKIAAMRAKRLAKKRGSIKAGADESLGGSSPLRTVLEIDLDVTKDICSRERQWRTRTSILQSSGKSFARNILALMESVKAREEGRIVPSRMGPPTSGVINTTTPRNIPAPTPPVVQAQPNYSRYLQEKFGKEAETAGFNIDTMGTYHGMNLKSVTEGSQPKRPTVPQSPAHSQPVPVKSPSGMGGGKRPSRTPIIIIPGTTTSLITMYNAKDILQDLRFMTTEEKKASGAKQETECLIQRRKEGVGTVPYRVIDTPQRLTMEDWDRVVAVFVMGPAWQFKGWPWDGNPVEIFSRIKAFHLKYEEMKLDTNVSKWAVHVIELSRTKRHLDRARLMTIWEQLDKHMMKFKPHLRF